MRLASRGLKTSAASSAHVVGHQQDFNALFLEHFQLRAVFGSGCGVGADVVDGHLAFFHAGFVVCHANANANANANAHAHAHGIGIGVGGARGKAQFGQAVFVGKVFAQAFLENGTKFCVELAVLAHVGSVLFTNNVRDPFSSRIGGRKFVRFLLASR